MRQIESLKSELDGAVEDNKSVYNQYLAYK